MLAGPDERLRMTLAGVMPYIVLHAKSLGISAGLAGTANAIMLITSIFLKFYLGALADKFRAVKGILIQVILLQGLAHLALYTCIPRIESTDVWRPISENNATFYSADREYRIICRVNTSEPVICSQSVINQTSLSECSFTKDFVNEHECKSQSRNGPVAIEAFQFWVFLALRIIAGGLASVGFSLTDAAIFAILGDHKELYGRQRLWGTIAWGGLSPLIGLINENFSTSAANNYAPGFYIHFTLTLIDLVAVCYLDPPEVIRPSKSILSDLRQLFRQPSILFVTLCIFVQGTLMGPIWSYAFLYFGDTLNVSQSLMGLQLLIQCFFGETPVMFFAGWIIARLGFRNSMALAVGGTGLRLAVYAFGTNPWHMLPIEVTHGLSFGLFYTAMTLFASRVSPKGTEASVQGIMSGMFEGAGIAAGSIVCGFLFDHIGQRQTMLFFTIYTFGFLVLQIIVNLMISETSISDDVSVKKLPPPEIQVEEASQVEQLLKGVDRTMPRINTDVSELKDISFVEEHDDAVA
ncbi:major facilitator superfamily domain-containing protein 6-like isoform X2 [Varroa jacobsoni]|uniref:major facilitator superfamily domain-containing protein 6-like isoform X2 n=1 Tax=Varroa jacobsoni TaxID=62625 RepID=UPI000BF8B7EC|nr:major facilitator superfamily domain-containing protein 6-like isoform X2 [Varroa jacobsoni]